MITKLTLKNMTFYGYHGVYSSERELGQRIEVDVELAADLSAAGCSDDLHATVNYVDIYTIVKGIVEKRGFQLIEAIGMAIINEISSSFDLEQVTVRVRKPNPPVGGFMEAIEFQVTTESQ